MRKTRIAPREYYHIYNKSITKNPLFHEGSDFARFIFLILFFQSPLSIKNTKRHIDYFMEYGNFEVDEEFVAEIVKNQLVELIAFTLMPTHFHLLVRELKEGAISRYIQRIAGGYAKYTEIKYEREGHLFRGPFGATHLETNNQLLYLSTYIHRNPRDLQGWKEKEHLYPWSSYQDFIGNNRWKSLLKPDIILGQFKSPKEYKSFVETSIAKEKKVLDHNLLFPSPY